MAKLGMKIDEYRRAKRVSVSTVCAATGISKATYNRFVNDQASLNLAAFLTLIHLLALDLDELAGVVGADYFALDTACRQVVEVVSGARSGEYGEMMATMQAQYVQTGHPGFAQLASVLAVYHHAVFGDEALAQEAAGGLWHTLMYSRLWLTFDRDVFSLIVPWLPFDAIDQACWERLGQLTAGDPLLDRIGGGYLQAAVATGDAAAVRSACAWVKNQPLAPNRLDSHPLRRFVVLLEAVVANKDAQAAYAVFRRQYQALFGAGRLAQYDRLWEQAMQTRFKPGRAYRHHMVAAALQPRASLAGVLEWVRHGRRLNVDAACQLVGISKSTWHRAMRRLMSCKLETFFGMMAALTLNVADLQALWTGAGSELSDWLARLARIDAAAGAVDAQVAAFDAAFGHQPVAYPQRVARLMHLEAEVAAGEALEAPARIREAVAQIWGTLNDLEDWTRFEYQVLIPVIEYLDYPKVRLLLSRYLNGPADLGNLLPLRLVDVLGSELLVGALRSDSAANIQDALAVMAGLEAKRHGLNFVIGQRFATMVQAALGARPQAAVACYHQTRDALAYFAPSKADAALRQMLDWLWEYLATKGVR